MKGTPENKTTTLGDSHMPQVPAMESGLRSNVVGSQGSPSNNREGAGVASQASANLYTTSAATSKESTNESNRRTINLGKLSDRELLSMFRDYICTMSALATNNRKVHRELKYNLAYAGKIMTQYMIRNQKSRCKASKNEYTQMEALSLDKTQAQEVNTSKVSKKVSTINQSCVLNICKQVNIGIRKKRCTRVLYSNQVPGKINYIGL